MSSIVRLPSLRLALPAVAAIAMAASSASAVDVYTIGNGGASILRYSTDNTASVTQIPLTGAADLIDSIDSRPATGQLFGYSSSTNTFYTINTTTGALTVASTSVTGAGTLSFVNGLDWNPTIDRLRLVSDAGDNVVFNPVTGTTTAATNLFYVAGDPYFGTTPSIVDNAYTNSYGGATTTTQYVLDYSRNSLARLNNNTGELTTVASITLDGEAFDFDNFTGFDIYTDGAKNNIAYAQFFDGTSDGLYTIDLVSGAATLIGVVNDEAFEFGYSLAVVPEPTSIAALAGLGVVGLRRRR